MLRGYRNIRQHIIFYVQHRKNYGKYFRFDSLSKLRYFNLQLNLKFGRCWVLKRKSKEPSLKKHVTEAPLC